MPSRQISAPVRRRLRQEAGFGCCVCGYPFIEYHHIRPFSSRQHHNPREMMVLCPNHHHEATVQSLSLEAQYEAKGNPFNVARGFADGLLKVNASALAVEAGSNYFVGPGFKFVVDGESLLTLASDSSGRLTLSVAIYDADDSLQLLVDENEWVTGDPRPWDVEYHYNLLKVRRRAGEVVLDIDARTLPVSIRGVFKRKGQTFEISPSRLLINGVVANVTVQRLGLVGYRIEANTAVGQLSLRPYPPFQKAMIVSHPDPHERLQNSLSAYRELAREVRVPKNSLCFCGSNRRFKACCGARNSE